MMQEPKFYQIKVQGQVDESELNAMSPIQTIVVRVDADEEHPYAATLFTIYADQSGLVGLVRHLHGRGLVLLSITRER